jgi:hypothetical protein
MVLRPRNPPAPNVLLRFATLSALKILGPFIPRQMSLRTLVQVELREDRTRVWSAWQPYIWVLGK